MECQTAVHVCKWVRSRWDFSCPHHASSWGTEAIKPHPCSTFPPPGEFAWMTWSTRVMHKHCSALLGECDCNWYSYLVLICSLCVCMCMCMCTCVCAFVHACVYVYMLVSACVIVREATTGPVCQEWAQPTFVSSNFVTVWLMIDSCPPPKFLELGQVVQDYLLQWHLHIC